MSAPASDRLIRRVAEECAVYRMLDRDGRLLYVGKTGSAGQRFGDHSAKRWFPLVATIALQWYGSEPEAASAETRAILDEGPAFNIVGIRDSLRSSGRLAAGIDFPLALSAVPDVLSVFRPECGLHWQTIAERLATSYPDRWFGVSGAAISVKLRALGVPSVSLREPGREVRRGCRRSDIVAAGARLREEARH